jgi:hypothetical protein
MRLRLKQFREAKNSKSVAVRGADASNSGTTQIMKRPDPPSFSASPCKNAGKSIVVPLAAIKRPHLVPGPDALIGSKASAIFPTLGSLDLDTIRRELLYERLTADASFDPLVTSALLYLKAIPNVHEHRRCSAALASGLAPAVQKLLVISRDLAKAHQEVCIDKQPILNGITSC